jgi:hypothetical protein
MLMPGANEYHCERLKNVLAGISVDLTSVIRIFFSSLIFLFVVNFPAVYFVLRTSHFVLFCVSLLRVNTLAAISTCLRIRAGLSAASPRLARGETAGFPLQSLTQRCGILEECIIDNIPGSGIPVQPLSVNSFIISDLIQLLNA